MEKGTQNLRGEFIKIHWNGMRFYPDLCFERKKKQMDGWMDGWVDRWMDGWIERKRERKKRALFLKGQVSAMGTV